MMNYGIKKILFLVVFLLFFMNNVFALPGDRVPGNNDLARMSSKIKYDLGGGLRDEMNNVSEDDFLADDLKGAGHFYGFGYVGHFQSAEGGAKEPYTDAMENYCIEEIAPSWSKKPLEEIGHILHLLEDMMNHSHKR
jgi:hypothetical protein